MNGALPVAAELKTVYLALSETFIHRLLAHLRRWQPRVLAEHLVNLERFPLPDVRRLQRVALWRRVLPFAARHALRDEALRAPFRWTAQLAHDLADVHVLNAHFGEAGLACLPLQRRTGLPLVTSFQGRDVAKLAARSYGRWLYRPLFRYGAAFTAVSEYMRGQLITLGAPSERVVVVRDGVDVDAAPFAPRVWPPDGRVRLLTAGRLVEKKGTTFAIAALARLAARSPGLTLTVIGDGPLRAVLQRQAAAPELAGRVRFLGEQAVERVLAEMAAAHLFILPCVTAKDGDQEGVPVVLMEAQAAGLPVVSTWHAGVPEVVRDGVSGCLARERDAEHLAALLARLLDAPERWTEMGAAGRAHIVAEFDVRRASATLEDVYDAASREGRMTGRLG